MEVKRVGRKPADITGKRFGRLVAVEFAGWNKFKNRQWKCICDCGNEHFATAGTLLNGSCNSCGCLKSDIVITRNTTHGLLRKHPVEYAVWCGVKSRCNCKSHTSWKYYGGRGITICKRWNDSFACFLDDMGPRVDSTMTIERVDNSKGYKPDNCIWANMSIQGRNTRKTVRLKYKGKNTTIPELSERSGIGTEVIRRRIKRGWTVEESVSVPSGSGRIVAIRRNATISITRNHERQSNRSP